MAIHPSNLWIAFRQTKLSALSSAWLSGCLLPRLAQGILHFQYACKAASGPHDAGCSWTDVALPWLFRPPLPLSPVPSPGSIISKWTECIVVTADVIATWHHWCYDNSKSSLSVIHRSILGCRWMFQIMHHNTWRLRPLRPCCLWGKDNICFCFHNSIKFFNHTESKIIFFLWPKMR